jgi:FkbM family methyltransferase
MLSRTKWLIDSCTRRIVRLALGHSLSERLALYLLRASRIDPREAAYRSVGVGKWQNAEATGESYLIRQVLPLYVKKSEPVFFDVGANIGSYAKSLSQSFPNARIYAFEPNPASFNAIKQTAPSLRILPVNVGLSDAIGVAQMWTYASDAASAHATLYADVLTDIHAATSTMASPVALTTVDAFCEEKAIDFIDFMKIDTEGHELSVLKGATRMLRDRRIGAIQFEFNTMNVISRCFMYDFYQCLTGYLLYRLDSKRLVPLGAYVPEHEIFRFQNIVAIPETVSANR